MAYKNATMLAPDDAYAWLGLGLAQNQTGQSEEALSSFEKAITLMPQNADAHYNKGLALVAAGRFQEALSAFERVLEIDPGNAPAAYSINLTRNRFNRHCVALQDQRSRKEISKKMLLKTGAEGPDRNSI